MGTTVGIGGGMKGYGQDQFLVGATIFSSQDEAVAGALGVWDFLGNVSWLRFLGMDWWQIVAFVEGGRVANTCSVSELTQDWKLDVGGSIRAMVSGGIVRFCVAFSEEGSSIWAMVGHPF